MADAFAFCFGLVFPLAAFAGGVYLILRGMRHGGSAPDAAGLVSSSVPLSSPLGNAECAYYRIVVERHLGAHARWKQAYSTEARAPLRVGGRQVSLENADVRASAACVHAGYPKPGRGMLDGLRANARQITALADFSAEVAPGEYLDDGVLSAVLGLPGAAGKLKRHLGGALRVSEYALPVGVEAFVFMDPGLPKRKGAPLHGTPEYPLLVCDKESLGRAPLMEEKSKTSLALGGFMIVVSLALIVLLLFS